MHLAEAFIQSTFGLYFFFVSMWPVPYFLIFIKGANNSGQIILKLYI